MTTYVLVHGACHGAWVWDRVVPLLPARAVAPHLYDDAGLADHAGQVAEVLEGADDDVVLVGHSYAGWLEERLRSHPVRSLTEPTRLTGVVDRIPGTAVYGRSSPLPFADLGRALGYRTVPIDGPHDVMITDPRMLAGILSDGNAG